jgi:hypothetical protein
VSHTLTLGAVEKPVILEFVREKVKLLKRAHCFNDIRGCTAGFEKWNMFDFPLESEPVSPSVEFSSHQWNAGRSEPDWLAIGKAVLAAGN